MNSETVLFLLNMCLYPTNKDSYKNNDRIQQYATGISKFYSFLSNFDNIPVLLTDNTVNYKSELPQTLLDILLPGTMISVAKNNKYGQFNKGAGVIEQLKYLKNKILKYK